MRTNTILYGAYGANRDPKMLEAITGNPNLVGKLAIFQNVELCVQGLAHIPDTVPTTSPVTISPKKIITDEWGHSNFETYTIRRANGTQVRGRVYELTPQERALVAEWEMIEYGWYQSMDITATLEDGTKLIVNTEGLRDGSLIDRIVDGLEYPTYLNEQSVMLASATQTREDYFMRVGSASHALCTIQ